MAITLDGKQLAAIFHYVEDAVQAARFESVDEVEHLAGIVRDVKEVDPAELWPDASEEEESTSSSMC